jgi:integrase
LLACIKCKKEIPNDAKFCQYCGQNQKQPLRKKAKRPNGSGTVYKIGGKRRKPWAAVTPGKKLLGTYATKTEAETILLNNRIAPPAPKSDFTLQQIYDEWSTLKFKSASDTLKRIYKSAWGYLKSISTSKMRDIRSGEYQIIIDETEKIRSWATLEHIKTLIVQLSNYAMQNDIINKNYASFVKLPPKPDTTKTAFNEMELKKIEQAAADGVPYADCVLMLCYTGWRIEEFLLLTKFSYDKENDVLIGGIKSEAGKDRIVPVHSKIKPYLLKWIDKNGETIICREDGSKFPQQSFREKCFTPALAAIGVRDLDPHECRHTFSTLLHRQHVDPINARQMMGHASYDTDEKTYIHVNIEELKNEIEKL